MQAWKCVCIVCVCVSGGRGGGGAEGAAREQARQQGRFSFHKLCLIKASLVGADLLDPEKCPFHSFTYE
jgi:hypothetical protein